MNGPILGSHLHLGVTIGLYPYKVLYIQYKIFLTMFDNKISWF